MDGMSHAKERLMCTWRIMANHDLEQRNEGINFYANNCKWQEFFLRFHGMEECKIMVQSTGRKALPNWWWSAMSTGIWSVVLLLSFCHWFGLTDKHKIDCEGEFLPCYKVLTLSARQNSITERFFSKCDIVGVTLSKRTLDVPSSPRTQIFLLTCCLQGNNKVLSSWKIMSSYSLSNCFEHLLNRVVAWLSHSRCISLTLLVVHLPQRW